MQFEGFEGIPVRLEHLDAHAGAAMQDEAFFCPLHARRWHPEQAGRTVEQDGKLLLGFVLSQLDLRQPNKRWRDGH